MLRCLVNLLVAASSNIQFFARPIVELLFFSDDAQHEPPFLLRPFHRLSGESNSNPVHYISLPLPLLLPLCWSPRSVFGSCSRFFWWRLDAPLRGRLPLRQFSLQHFLLRNTYQGHFSTLRPPGRIWSCSLPSNGNWSVMLLITYNMDNILVASVR